jgi:hypothetical protein
MLGTLDCCASTAVALTETSKKAAFAKVFNSTSPVLIWPEL